MHVFKIFLRSFIIFAISSKIYRPNFNALKFALKLLYQIQFTSFDFKCFHHR